MINCIVNRRLCQARKAQGSRLIVLETTPPTLPELQNYYPEEIALSNRRLPSAYQGYGGGGVFSQQPGMFSLQGITVDGRPTSPNENEEKCNATASTQRPSRGEKMLSKHFVAPNARHNRRASLHGCDFRPIHGFSAVDADAVLHPKEVVYLQKIALASNEDPRRRNLSNGMAHISIDGRIMEAVSASSATIGGSLGEESGVWDCFAPLQRVLIVAVAAAAAASSKHTNHKEITSKAVSIQENALSLMRRELSNLWDQVAPEENGPLSLITPKHIDIDPASSSRSPVTPVWDAPNRETPMVKTPEARKLQSKTGLSFDSPGSCDSLQHPINKSDLLDEVPKDRLQADQPRDAKWYSNPLTEHSERSEDSTHSEHYFEDCTPEKRQRIFSRFTPDTIEPVKWMSVQSSFTPITTDTITPLTDRKRFSFEDSNSLSTSLEMQSLNPGETAALRARCATILAEVKNQVLSVLDKEASQVMAALSHVIEKAQELEEVDRTRSLYGRANTPENKSQASAALKRCVEKASAQVESLQAAVVSIWHTIGPRASASLKLSPQEFESFLCRVTHLTPETLTSGDEKVVFTREEGIQEWNQWLLVKHSEATVPSLLSKIEAAANTSGGDLQEICSPSWKHVGHIAAAVGMAVLKTVDSLMAPLDGREAAENFDSPVAKQRVGGPSGDAQFLAHQLLGELEKAAAKIAGMENQMVSLKQSMRESEAQREKAELKLAEATACSHQNQVNFEREMNELTAKLREKESAYDDLMRSRKVMFLVKSTEIAELKIDCQRRDMVLDDITAAAQATREASDQRLAVLEDVCRRKDSAIQELRDEIIALEDKVHELQLQSPLLLRGNGRRSTSLVRLSTEEALSLEDTFNGLCRQSEQTQDPSLPHESVALQSNIDDISGHPQSSRTYKASVMMDFSATANTSPELQTKNCRLDPPESFMPAACSIAENSARVRASTSSLPTRAKEYSASGKPLAVSIDRSVLPFPDATLFDDFLEVESSLQARKADEGALLNSGFCTPSNGDTLRCSLDFDSASKMSGSGLQHLKSMTLGPKSAGRSTGVSNFLRPKGQVSFTSADENKKPSGVLRPTKASSLKARGRSEATKKPSWDQEEGEITWVNAVVLASLELNGSLNASIISRRASNTSNDLKEIVWKPIATSNGTKNIRRTRWL